MSQSKRHSLIESLSNTAIGWIINLFAQIIIFPLFGIHIPIGKNIGIGLCFTGISVARGYALRRWFTTRTEVAE